MSRLSDLILVTTKLIALVERETALIAARKGSSVAALETERSDLALVYTREMTLLRRDPAALKAANAGELAELKAATARFQRALDLHARAIERVRRITEGIVKSIADEVVARRAPRLGYTRNAATPASRAPASIAFNSLA